STDMMRSAGLSSCIVKPQLLNSKPSPEALFWESPDCAPFLPASEHAPRTRAPEARMLMRPAVRSLCARFIMLPQKKLNQSPIAIRQTVFHLPSEHLLVILSMNKADQLTSRSSTAFFF